MLSANYALEQWTLPSATCESQMKRIATLILALIPAFSQTATGPILNGIITANAYGGFSAAASGSFVEIYGASLSGTTRGWTTNDFNGPTAPTSLDGVTVTVAGTAAYINYVSPGQVNIQIPDGVPNGPADVVLSYRGRRALRRNLPSTQPNPGSMRRPVQCERQAVHWSLAQRDGRVRQRRQHSRIPHSAGPTRRNPHLLRDRIWPGTGRFGRGQTAPAQTSLTDKLAINIGNATATIAYAGLAPRLVGLYQFNVVVPPNAGGGDQLIHTTLNGSTVALQTLYLTLAGGGGGGGAPPVPSNITATAGDASAIISFSTQPPPPNGGTPNITYTATCTGGGASFKATGNSSPITVTGLVNGTSYSCVVTATNGSGTSQPSTAATVVPQAGSGTTGFTLTSSAGIDGGTLPADYTCDGTGSTLPLAWSNPPAGTAEYAVLLSTSRLPAN